ncbi:MAG: 3'-5' exonuclease domain-containing protein 2 [Marinilabiliaceae bacterium]|nr:3'-5' exonuclease domain-containing protein 2 [Marinilabiliaceae bacterium]
MTKTISNEQMNQLPLRHFEGNVVVIENTEAVDEMVYKLSLCDVIGFDTETKPSFKKGSVNQVALLQLSTPDTAYLFRLNIIGLHYRIIELLEDETIIKVGVGIRDDLRFLRRLKCFQPKGFVELQTIATDLGFKDTSLKKLAAMLMKVRISKRQRLSNWETNELSQAQIIYAATDAWASLEIYNKLFLYEPSLILETLEF